MRKDLFLVFIVGALFLVGTSAARAAETLVNAGFARGSILFSKDPFFAGDKVRIYTIVWNGSTDDLAGRVEFYDNGKVIGGADFTAKGGGTVRDVWTDWTAAGGDHNIVAKIVNAKVSAAGGVPRAVTLDAMESGAAQIAVDLDTDKDGIGDKNDLDIDGDGLTNEEETKYGYDILKKDTNGDGVGDKKDRELQLAKLATEEAALARKAASTTEAIGDKFEAVKDIVGTTTLNAVTRAVRSATQTLTAARVAGEKWAEAKSAVLTAELAVNGDPTKIKTSGKGLEIPERPFKYAYKLFTVALGFILASQWLTYLSLAFIAYIVLKVFIHKVMNRG